MDFFEWPLLASLLSRESPRYKRGTTFAAQSFYSGVGIDHSGSREWREHNGEEFTEGTLQIKERGREEERDRKIGDTADHGLKAN